MQTWGTTEIVLAAVGVALVLALALVAFSRRRRSGEIRQLFGSEYDRTVEAYGSRSKAEKELAAAKRRFERADIRPLALADRDRYLELWRGIQARFVDNPQAAVGEADFLVSEVMRVRGYPAADLKQRLADVAVGHPHLVDHYRRACDVASRQRGGQVGTEDLRQAVIHYRALFDDLLAVEDRVPAGRR